MKLFIGLMSLQKFTLRNGSAGIIFKRLIYLKEISVCPIIAVYNATTAMMPPAATPGGVIHSIGMSTAIQIAVRIAPVTSQILPVDVVSAVWSEILGESDTVAPLPNTAETRGISHAATWQPKFPHPWVARCFFTPATRRNHNDYRGVPRVSAQVT